MNEWLAWILVVLNVAMMPYFLLLLGVAAGHSLTSTASAACGGTVSPRSRFLVADPGP